MGLKQPMMAQMPPPPAVDPSVAAKEAASEGQGITEEANTAATSLISY